jgi:hypothetical protein
MKVESMVGIGHPQERRQPLRADELQYDKVKHNRYDESWNR